MHRVLTKAVSGMENPVITAQEIMKLLSISRTSAYLLIRRLNNELQEKGKITLRGRTSRKYFKERMNLA